MVVVFVNVQVKGGITVHVVRPQTRSQSFLDGFIRQPILQLGGSVYIVDDALFVDKKNIHIYQQGHNFRCVNTRPSLDIFLEVYLNIVGDEDLTEVKHL